MTPKDNIESTNRSKKKGDEGEDSEEETARLLTEDPLDLILKNEHVGDMLSVSKKSSTAKPYKCFKEAFNGISSEKTFHSIHSYKSM